MALFQQSVISHYLKELDQTKVLAAFRALKENFNLEVQVNLLKTKEEEYQEGFIMDLFVSSFGYIRKPKANWTIRMEKKSIDDNTKADAVIVNNHIEEGVLAVIELKSTKTTVLDRIEEQAFGYFYQHQPLCRYVITSNFQKLRLYVDDNQEYVEFDIFDLVNGDEKMQFERFKLMYLYLNYEFVQKGIPAKIRQDTIQYEKKITTTLYTQYTDFRLRLHGELQKQNPKVNKFVLFKKTQKLIDRFLFILFAEDKDLLPTKTIDSHIKNWNKSGKGSLYDSFKTLFDEVNTGNSAKSIFSYEGELFEPDAVLDGLTLNIGNTLEVYLGILEGYDFKTEIDVNILGHIFEQSLNDMDEMKALSEGERLEKSKTKRKKEGVFYTPQYITRYIVENTVGVLCREKEQALGIIEGKTVTEKQLNDYRRWLSTLTVIDPACGSGAFLNQTLDFFIREHRRIDERMAGVKNKPIIYTDTINADFYDQILENNIFGVDLNEEAVEIAKLSLWLRTAKKGKKLSNLSDNIKVGNSLIEDPSVSDAAFNWKKEFPQVFEKGGFDVVIGNPPYGAKLSTSNIDYFVTKFGSWGITNKFSDTYFVFTIHSVINLLKKNGILGFITPNTWRLIESGKIFRYKMLTTFNYLQIIQHTEKVFSDATVDCDTFILRNFHSFQNEITLIQKKVNEVLSISIINQQELLKNDFINLGTSDTQRKIVDKIFKQSLLVKDFFDIKNGVKPYEKGKGNPPQTAKTLIDKPFTLNYKKDKTFVPLIGGSNFHRYKNFWNNDEWISYGAWLAAPRDTSIFDQKEKLIFRQTSDSIIGTLIGSGFVMRNNTHIILKRNDKIDLLYILAILNSKVGNFIYWTINPEKGEALAEVKAFHLGMLPFKDILRKEQQPFIEKVETILSQNTKLLTIKTDVLEFSKTRFPTLTVKRTMETWYELDWKAFDGELKKQKCILLPKEQTEWSKYFEQERGKAQAILRILETTDREIDALVYQLYGLTKAEIELVKNS